MTKICTSIEQSKKLLELGLNPDTADMFWLRIIGETRNTYGDIIPLTEDICQVAIDDNNLCFHQSSYDEDDTMPAWSLSALMSLMPQNCAIDKEKNKYVASYVTSHEVLKWDSNTPFEGAVNMMCWLLENKKL